jgi:restriction system protein
MATITHKRRGEYLQAVLNILVERGGSAPAREVILQASEKLSLSTFEKEPTPKNQNERWWAMLQLDSINLVKAGWLRKHKAVWYITEEGKKALSLDPERFNLESIRLYREWRRVAEPEEVHAEDSKDQDAEPLSYEQSLGTAREEIKNRISAFNAYEFQDLVAALFHGMGYFTPFVAAPGPDGGTDIVAYKDPLGAEAPRIRVQVKHQKGSVGRPEIQNLLGILRGEGYVGVFVSTGGFSKQADDEIRTAQHHIDKIDLERFIDLWEQHYDKMSEEDRALLPLRKISFLAPEE